MPQSQVPGKAGWSKPTGGHSEALIGKKGQSMDIFAVLFILKF